MLTFDEVEKRQKAIEKYRIALVEVGKAKSVFAFTLFRYGWDKKDLNVDTDGPAQAMKLALVSWAENQLEIAAINLRSLNVSVPD